MTPERSKDLLNKYKGILQKLMKDYNQSGAGSHQVVDDGSQEVDLTKYGHFDMSLAETDGRRDNRAAFLNRVA